MLEISGTSTDIVKCSDLLSHDDPWLAQEGEKRRKIRIVGKSEATTVTRERLWQSSYGSDGKH
jgi:hypothetical protein